MNMKVKDLGLGLQINENDRKLGSALCFERLCSYVLSTYTVNPETLR